MFIRGFITLDYVSNLSEEGDWSLTHGVGVTDVRLDDLCEGFLDPLQQ